MASTEYSTIDLSAQTLCIIMSLIDNASGIVRAILVLLRKMSAKTTHRPTSRKRSLSVSIFSWLITVIAILAIVHLIMQYLDLNVYHQLNGQVFEISNRVDFDDEASIPTWISQVILLGISLSAFFAAFLQKQVQAKQAWTSIGVVGLILSIDEVAALHELILQTAHLILYQESRPTIYQNAWIVLLPFIVALGALLAVKIIKHVPRKTTFLMIVGAGILVFGAAVVDALTNADNVNTFAIKGVMVAIEESLEIIGTSTIMYAILDYLETNFGGQIRAAREKLLG